MYYYNVIIIKQV